LYWSETQRQKASAAALAFLLSNSLPACVLSGLDLLEGVTMLDFHCHHFPEAFDDGQGLGTHLLTLAALDTGGGMLDKAAVEKAWFITSLGAMPWMDDSSSCSSGREKLFMGAWAVCPRERLTNIKELCQPFTQRVLTQQV
jgi:hypothetical protein